MRWKAVIFDMDGTLLETERLVVEAGLAAFERMGLPRRADLMEDMVGVVSDPALPTLVAAFGADFDRATFERLWDEGFLARLEQGIPLRPGVLDLFAHLDAIGMPRALATNSHSDAAHRHLARAGIGGFFAPEHVHGRDHVAHPKPAPDLFLLAAKGLGVDPADCLVFEDSDPGAEGAVAAGTTVVLVPDQRQPRFDGAQFRAESLIAGARAAGLLE